MGVEYIKKSDHELSPNFWEKMKKIRAAKTPECACMRSEKMISQKAKLAIVSKHLFLVFYTRAIKATHRTPFQHPHQQCSVGSFEFSSVGWYCALRSTYLSRYLSPIPVSPTCSFCNWADLHSSLGSWSALLATRDVRAAANVNRAEEHERWISMINQLRLQKVISFGQLKTQLSWSSSTRGWSATAWPLALAPPPHDT